MNSSIVPIQDVNIKTTTPLTSPADLKKEFPLTDDVATSVFDTREPSGKFCVGKIAA